MLGVLLRSMKDTLWTLKETTYNVGTVVAIRTEGDFLHNPFSVIKRSLFDVIQGDSIEEYNATRSATYG